MKKKYLHFTPEEYVSGILKEGLVPSSSSVSAKEMGEALVYLVSPLRKDAEYESIIGDMGIHSARGRIAQLRVDLPSSIKPVGDLWSEAEPGGEWEDYGFKSYATSSRIPPSSIKLERYRYPTTADRIAYGFLRYYEKGKSITPSYLLKLVRRLSKVEGCSKQAAWKDLKGIIKDLDSEGYINSSFLSRIESKVSEKLKEG